MATKARLLNLLFLLLLLTSSADRLTGTVLEEALSHALASREHCEQGTSDDKPVLHELRQLRNQLDEVIEGLETKQKTPACEERPMPINQTSFQRPDKLACAHSCLQLRHQNSSSLDGVYWFTGMPVPVLCDFTHDGGGWTLLLTAVSRDGWDLLSVVSRSELSPSLDDNYSILRHADAIKNLNRTGRFAYRIEAQAEKGRRHWGGVWLAPRAYSFVGETDSQSEVRLVRKFDRWSYNDKGIERRMPWLSTGDKAVLTMNAAYSSRWWGTMVTHPNADNDNQHSPWIQYDASNSGTVLYWMREQEM